MATAAAAQRCAHLLPRGLGGNHERRQSVARVLHIGEHGVDALLLPPLLPLELRRL